MDAVIAALWELRTWFAFSLGVLIVLLIAALLMMARQQSEPADPPTILILPPDEPMEQVNMSEFVRRWS
jgi:uncharacterized protein YggT (Ycf19 family)